MITPEMLKQSQDINKTVIEVIFMYEKSFKEKVLNGNGWYKHDYEIERCHLSGSVCRITLRHLDYREKDIYTDINDVYDWFLVNQDEVLN